MIESGFTFLLSKPKAPLSECVQAIWSASVSQPEPLVKSLYADAGSGIIFNLFGDISIGGKTLAEGIVMLPVKSKAENIVLRPGAKLAGIRFHPAFGYGVLGQHYKSPTLLTPDQNQYHSLQPIFSKLHTQDSDKNMIDTLSQWADESLSFKNTIPDYMVKALNTIEHLESLQHICDSTHKSQRQIERHFRLWLGMTPKQYQRILRIKKTIYFLRSNQTAKLADVAQQFGFSDQAHMTREFRAIARITPKQV